MNVPFAPAAASPAAGPAVLARAGAAPRNQAGSVSTQTAATRAHGAGAEARSAAAAQSRNPFASVLDAVQQDSPIDVTAALSAAASAQWPPEAEGSPVTAEGEADGAAATSVATAELPAPIPPPTSSWLLLALEHGTVTRTEAPDAPTVPPADHDTDALVAICAPAVTESDLGPTATLIPAAPVVAHPSYGHPASPAAALPVVATAASWDRPARPAATSGAPMASEGGAVVPAGPPATSDGTAPSPQIRTLTGDQAEDAEAAMPSPGPSPVAHTEGPAFVARRGVEPTAAPHAEAREPVAPGQVTVRPAAPGPAISRLAQSVSRLAGEGATPVTPPVRTGPAEGTSAASPALPTARASEVLLRLAQAGGPAPPRSHDGGPVAPVVVPVGPVSDFGQGMFPVASASQAAVMPLPPAVGEQVASQIVSSLKLQWRDGVGEAKLHLRPDALGQVSLTIRVEQGAVTAVVRAESPQVQEWVLQHQQMLRQQLLDAGLRLDDLSVNPDREQAHQERQQDTPDDSRDRPRRRRASGRDSGLHFDQLL